MSIALALAILTAAFAWASVVDENKTNKVIWQGLFFFTLLTTAFYMASYQPQQLYQVTHDTLNNIDTYTYTTAPTPSLTFYLVAVVFLFILVVGLNMVGFVVNALKALMG